MKLTDYLSPCAFCKRIHCWGCPNRRFKIKRQYRQVRQRGRIRKIKLKRNRMKLLKIGVLGKG